MGLPLVIPEGFIALVIGDPVRLHVVQRASLSSILEKFGDVGVGSALVAVFAVSTIAVVGPETVDRPGCGGPSGRISIPELDLLK